MNSAEKSRQLARRQQRVCQRIFGTDERPRLNVFRSSGHIYAQIINDLKGTTLAAASSLGASTLGARLTALRGAPAGLRAAAAWGDDRALACWERRRCPRPPASV